MWARGSCWGDRTACMWRLGKLRQGGCGKYHHNDHEMCQALMAPITHSATQPGWIRLGEGSRLTKGNMCTLVCVFPHKHTHVHACTPMCSHMHVFMCACVVCSPYVPVYACWGCRVMRTEPGLSPSVPSFHQDTSMEPCAGCRGLWVGWYEVSAFITLIAKDRRCICEAIYLRGTVSSDKSWD